MGKRDHARDRALIAKSLRLMPHPVGKHLVTKFEVGDRVILKNGQKSTIIGINQYGDYLLKDFSGMFSGKVLTRASP